MAFPRHMYYDPANAYEFKQGRTCKGCKHEESIVFAGERVAMCMKDRKHSDNGGKKCKLYSERD